MWRVTKSDNDEYAQLMGSLQVSIGEVQEILLKMTELFRVMLSSATDASTEAKIAALHDMAIGGDKNDGNP
jgi:hypothetical protein